MDRLIGAFAARNIYPNARLVIDFGTATTLDFLSKAGNYLGGLILPGIGSTLGVLSSCAMLPKNIKLTASKKVIPTDTIASITKGITEGFSLMTNSLVKKYRKTLKFKPKETIVLTGGHAAIIKPFLDFPCQNEPLLVLKGLAMLGQKAF